MARLHGKGGPTVSGIDCAASLCTAQFNSLEPYTVLYKFQYKMVKMAFSLSCLASDLLCCHSPCVWPKAPVSAETLWLPLARKGIWSSSSRFAFCVLSVRLSRINIRHCRSFDRILPTGGFLGSRIGQDFTCVTFIDDSPPLQTWGPGNAVVDHENESDRSCGRVVLGTSAGDLYVFLQRGVRLIPREVCLQYEQTSVDLCRS